MIEERALSLRTDPEALSAYRKALVESRLGSAERVEAMSDADVVASVEAIARSILAMGASMLQIVEAVRVSLNALGARLATLSELIAPLVERQDQ